MGRKIYVSNLNYEATENELYGLFSPYGRIVGVKIIKKVEVIDQKKVYRSRGFAFVEFEDESDAGRSLSLNGFEFMNRELFVVPAIDKNPRAENGTQESKNGIPRRIYPSVKTMIDRTPANKFCGHCGQLLKNDNLKREHECNGNE